MLLKNKFFVALTGTITVYSILISIASYQIISTNEKEITSVATSVENKYIHKNVSHYANNISQFLNLEMKEIDSISQRYAEIIKGAGENTNNILKISNDELRKYSTSVYLTKVKVIPLNENDKFTIKQYYVDNGFYLTFKINITRLIYKLARKQNEDGFLSLIIDQDMNMVTKNNNAQKYLSEYKVKLNDITKIKELTFNEMITMRNISTKTAWDSEIHLGKEKYIVAIQPVKDYPWNVAVLIKKKTTTSYSQELTEKIHNNYNVFIKKIINTIIMLTILTLLLSTFITNYIKGPLILFSQWIKEIQEGNYEYNNPLLYRKDELGALARNVALMAQHISTLVDDLERKIDDRTNKLKKSKEIAESANIKKSKFIANISHELRTPLNAILGLSLYLIEKEEDQEKKKTLNTLYKAGEGLLEMVNDILDLSKIEANKIISNKEPNSIDNIITNIIDVISFQSNSKNIKIDYKKNEFYNLNIDKKHLNKIVMNLLSNSIKFTDQGGKININVKYINSTNLSTDLVLEFTDNGRGIEKKDIERIFNPFEQIHDQDKDQGTGLGLFITKKIIEDMNGNISIESEVGEGTSIFITLKDIEIIKSKIINKYHHMKREIHEMKSKKSIAIVDDIEFNREVLKRKLEPYDFNIIEGINGKDILEKLKNTSPLPDVIFTDIKMPIMNGIELSRRIKDSKDMKHIPVIAITAQGMLDEETKIKKYCDGYLIKPIDNKSLDSIISSLF